MVVAAVIKFISRKYPLFLKLLGTSKLRNRDPTFNEIGTQLFMNQGPNRDPLQQEQGPKTTIYEILRVSRGKIQNAAVNM